MFDSDSWAQWLMTAAGGALVVLVAFRTKLALMDRRIESRKAEIAAAEARLMVQLETQKADLETFEGEMRVRLAAMDRKLTMILQIAADLAKKAGVEARFSDVIVRFLADDASAGPPP